MFHKMKVQFLKLYTIAESRGLVYYASTHKLVLLPTISFQLYPEKIVVIFLDPNLR